MPAKQRGWSNDKRAPACSRQETARGREEDSIGRAQLGPTELATQHRELVAEHDDLELLELNRAEAQRRELQQALDHEVAERPEQRAAPPGGPGGDRPYGRVPAHQRRTELMHPTRQSRSRAFEIAGRLRSLVDHSGRQ